MHPHLMSELNRQHIEDLQREAAAERLARSVDRTTQPQLRERVRVAVAATAAGASVVAALLILSVR
jgi:hypothetical protein